MRGNRPFEEYLENKGFSSVAKFAEACGIKPQQIFNHIRGNFKPSIDAMFTYAKVLGVSVDEIMNFWYKEDFDELDRILGNK